MVARIAPRTPARAVGKAGARSKARPGKGATSGKGGSGKYTEPLHPRDEHGHWITKGGVKRPHDGTREQRAGLAKELRTARAKAKTRGAKSKLAKHARVMRAARRGQPEPKPRSRGASHPRRQAKAPTQPPRPIPRTREGTPRQRKNLANKIREARTHATTPERHTLLTEQVRLARSIRRDKVSKDAGKPGAAKPAKAPKPVDQVKQAAKVEREKQKAQREKVRQERAATREKARTEREKARADREKARVERDAAREQRRKDREAKASERARAKGEREKARAEKKARSEAARAERERKKAEKSKPPLHPDSISAGASDRERVKTGSIPNTNPNLKLHVDHREYIRGEHDKALRELADAAGMTPERYRAELDSGIKAAVDHGEFYIRVDRDVLPKVLGDGKFKSLFETGMSGGANDPEIRNTVEATVLGTPKTTVPAARPIYGYVSRPDFASAGTAAEHLVGNYGDAAIRLKPHVRERATVTMGDSLTWADNLAARPARSPISEAIAINTPQFRNAQKKLVGGNLSPGEWLDHANRYFSYTEAQYHGGLKADDIAEVAFSSRPSAKIRKALESHGIAWRTYKIDLGMPIVFN